MNMGLPWYLRVSVILNTKERKTLKVLVIGGGGREHAIARQFNVSPSVAKVFVAPGNDGMKNDAECVQIEQTRF